MNKLAALRLAPQDKVVLHDQFAKYMRGERVYPINVEVSPSGACQATCTGCWYLDQHAPIFLETQRTLRLLAEFKLLAVKSVTWTGGGDPSLHPDFTAIVRGAYDLGLEQGMFTNALASPKYDPSLFRWIRVTITDRPPRPEYIKHLASLCPVVGIAFNYEGPHDDDAVRRTLDMAENCMVSYVQVRPKLPPNGDTCNIEPPAIDHPLLHATEYKFSEARKKHEYKTCEAYHLNPFVFENGRVCVCAYMHNDPAYVLGNVYKNTFQEILDAAPPTVPVVARCQTCCKLHESNRAIHSARALQDVNFP